MISSLGEKVTRIDEIDNYYDVFWFESEEEFDLFKIFLRSKPVSDTFLNLKRFINKFEGLSYTSICLEPDEVIEFEEFKRKYNIIIQTIS